MPSHTRLTNPTLMATTRAVTVAASVFAGMNAMPVEPATASLALAALAGIAAYFAADVGILIAVAALSLPVLSVAPVAGIALLVIGIASVRYFGADGGRAFMVTALAVAGVYFGPAWVAIALAGYLLGAGEGALAAASACLVIEAIGIALGSQALGPVSIGAQTVLLDFSKLPASLLDPQWFAPSLRTLDATAVEATIEAISGVARPLGLIVQPMVWAVAAALTGRVAQEGRVRGNRIVRWSAIIVGVGAAAFGSAAAGPVVGGPLSASAAIATFAVSVVVAFSMLAVYERFFVATTGAPAAAEDRSPMGADDADVDELLTLIATAEDRLASEHTSIRTVMITDMKSFSRMTEEDGSILSAKAIQRHRDLLIPVVERHGGQGKSTGGDGLIAAFESPDAAVAAAVEMQQALARHNATHPSRRELNVRIGLAQGEVVLDKRGRPFIGAAINLAARIMNLADGGQAFAPASLVRTSRVRSRSLGSFELKNIAEPVDVVELLWDEGSNAAVG